MLAAIVEEATIVDPSFSQSFSYSTMAESSPSSTRQKHTTREEGASDDKCTKSTFLPILPINAALERVDVVSAGSSYGEGAANLGFPVDPVNLPALCAVTVRVASSLSSSYRFGLFLPSPPSPPSPSDGEVKEGGEEKGKWNSRFLTVGNGGFAGGINWLEMGAGARYGFASLSTDTGHNSTGTELEWALGRPESRIDWGWRAVHGSVELGKQLVEAYYRSSTTTSSSSSSSSDPNNNNNSTSTLIKHAYYSGCSTGGRQGLKELQISPASFDGVLVGAAAWSTSRLNNWATKVAQWNWPASKPGHIPWTALDGLARAIAAQCDGADGVPDGIVSAPEACAVDYAALTCTGDQEPLTEPTSAAQAAAATASAANATICLSTAQIETLKRVYGDWISTTTGELLQPGLLPGSEAQMPVVLNFSDASPYTIGYERYFLLDDPGFAVGDFNDSVAQLAVQFDPGEATADLYDLAAFRDRGGKLVMYHGMADALVPTKGSGLYYNRTVEAMWVSFFTSSSLFIIYIVFLKVKLLVCHPS